MSELNERLGGMLKSLRIGREWTLKRLSDETHGVINAGNWSVVERGGRAPSIHDLYFACRALGVTISEVVERAYGTVSSDNATHIQVDAPAKATIPVLTSVQAGMWQEFIADDAESCRRVLPPIKTTRDAFALLVRGDSMTSMHGPSFPEGYIIIVEPGRSPENRSMVIARQDGSDDTTFKQLVIDGPKRYLKPLNSQYAAFEIDEKTMICGVVTAAMWQSDL